MSTRNSSATRFSSLLRALISRQSVLWWLFIVAALALIYLPGLHNALVFDDERFNDAGVFSGHGSFEIKLRMISYGSFVWIQSLFGQNWPIQRVVNILIHLGVSFVLYRFVRIMMDQVTWPESDEQSRDSNWLPKSKDAAAIFGIAFFALNPVAVYGVAYLIQRPILLSTLFSVIALYAVAQAGVRRGWPAAYWLVGALAAYVLALFSKEHAVMLPVAATAVFFVVRRPERKLILKALSVALLFAVVAGVYFGSRLGQIFGQAFDATSREYLTQLAMLQPGIEALAWPLSIIDQAWLFFKYGAFWMLPYTGWMSIDLRPTFPLTLTSFPHVLGALAYPALMVASIWLMVKYADWRRFLGLALFIPAVLFVTEFSTVRIQDPFVLYRSYLWAISISLLAAMIWVGTGAKSIRWAIAVAAVVLTGFSMERVQSFRSDESVWADASRKVDLAAGASAVGRWRPLVNYGNQLIQKEQFQQAAEQYSAAVRTGDITGITDYHLATTQMKLGQYSAALDSFERAENKKIHFLRSRGPHFLHKGQTLFFSGRYEEAIGAVDLAMTGLTDTHSMKMALEARAKSNIKLGKFEDAIADYTKMVELLPNDPTAHIGLAMALKSAGRQPEALAILDQQMRQHDRPDIRAGRVIVLLDTKRIDEARAELRVALGRYPGNTTLRQLAQRLGL